MKRGKKGSHLKIEHRSNAARMLLGFVGLSLPASVLQAFAGDCSNSPPNDGQLAPVNLPQRLASHAPDEALFLMTRHLEERQPRENQHCLDAARSNFLQWSGGSETASALVDNLSDEADKRIGLTFSVGRGGCFESPPTMRVAVHDRFSEIDSDQSLAQSRQILQRAQDADEAALALSNQGRHPEELLNHTLALISNRQSLEEPSPGFFDGIDAFVFAESYPRLEMLMNVQSCKQTYRDVLEDECF